MQKKIYYHRELRNYSSTSLKMTIIKKYAQSLGLKDGDLVNIEIVERIS